MTVKPLTKNIIGFDGHTDFTRYERLGGYAAVRKQLAVPTPTPYLNC